MESREFRLDVVRERVDADAFEVGPGFEVEDVRGGGGRQCGGGVGFVDLVSADGLDIAVGRGEGVGAAEEAVEEDAEKEEDGGGGLTRGRSGVHNAKVSSTYCRYGTKIENSV